MRRGFVKVDLEVMKRILSFPEAIQIVDVEMDVAKEYVARLYLEDSSDKVLPEGCNDFRDPVVGICQKTKNGIKVRFEKGI